MSNTYRIRFGADGLRSDGQDWPLTAQTGVIVGRALGRFAASLKPSPEIVVGRDTRQSGVDLLHGLMSGLLDEGAVVTHVGILPTPGIAYLTRRIQAQLGVSVTASHNPHHYNGFKVFKERGLRLDENEERVIEDLLDEVQRDRGTNTAVAPPVRDGKHLVDLYIEDHVYHCPVPSHSLAGLKLVVDCAHGATSTVAEAVFDQLGVEAVLINTHALGRVINERCGSEHVRAHPENLQAEVEKYGAAYGFAFDGDGDRLVVVDRQGGVYSGLELLYALAVYYHGQNKLRHQTVVTTDITNRGLAQSLSRHGIHTLIARGQGDKVLEKAMWDGGFRLGGEPGGNIVINDGHHTAADALYTAVFLSGLLVTRPDDSLAGLTQRLTKYPQALASLRLKDLPPIQGDRSIRAQVEQSLATLGPDARIVGPRYATTEAGVCRVMVEGAPEHSVDQVRAEAEAILHRVRVLGNAPEAEIKVQIMAQPSRG